MRFFSSKKSQPVKTGFMGDTSPEQDQVLEQFKAWIAAGQVADLKALDFDDYDLLRFCRARKFVLADIQVMFTKFVNWREKEEVDTIIDTYKYDERAAVQEVYPHGYHGVDKLGRPVYIERFGILNTTKLFQITTQERVVRHYVQEYEILMKIRFPAASKLAGKRVEQGLTIIDLTGGGMTTMNSQTKALFQLAASVGSDYYPEIMGNLFVTNAPMLFSGIWAVCKGFLDEKTRNKIKICGSSFKDKLLQYLDDENIPSFLGGKCTCSNYPGGCISSSIGPWNDYELTPEGLVEKKALKAAQDEEEKKEEQ